MSNAGYEIQVGSGKPTEMIISHPNKDGDPKNTQVKNYIRVGTHLILNTARVWGRRVIRDNKGVVKDSREEIEPNTPGYRGEIEFMEWGKEGGYAITIRYLPQSRSLDYEYQEQIQRIVVKDDQFTHIQLNAGRNKFDYKKQELLIQFLKVIPDNLNSRSKNPNPDIKGYRYFEITEEHVDNLSIKRIEDSTTAANMVKAISNKPRELRILFEIMGEREEFGDTNLLSGDRQIYKTLYEYAYSCPEDFFELIQAYKTRVRGAFDMAASYKVLDLTKDGHIAIEVKNRKELPFESVDILAKGEGMIDWVLEHYVEDEVFKGTQVFLEYVSKLK